jgi:hypothetical protein
MRQLAAQLGAVSQTSLNFVVLAFVELAQQIADEQFTHGWRFVGKF